MQKGIPGLLVSLALGACGSSSPISPPTTQAAVASVSVSLSLTTVPVGGSSQATATLQDASQNALTGRAIAWNSNSPSVASVDGNGRITALQAGTASITATSEGKAGFATLTVQAVQVPLAAGTIYLSMLTSAFTGGPLTYEIVAVNPSSGELTNLTKSPDRDEAPRPSPDGQFILYSANAGPMFMRKDGTAVATMPWNCGALGSCVGNSTRSTINKGSATDNRGAAWLADGRLRFIAQRSTSPVIATFTPPSGAVTTRNIDVSMFDKLDIRAVSSPNADLESYTVNAALYLWRHSTGTETSVASPCPFATTCTSPPVWKPDGAFLYILRQSAIWEFSTTTASSRQVYAAAALSSLAISPDGQSLAFVENEDLRILRLNSGTVTTVFTKDLRNASPTYGFVVRDESIAWSPDSKSVAFEVAGSGSTLSLYGVNADGTGLRNIRGLNSTEGLSWGR